jgi:hypothetical protein
MVVIEQPTQRRITAHCYQRRWMIGILEPQRNDIAQALMRSVLVVMLFNLPEHVAKMLFSKQNQVVQGLPSLSHEPLGIRIAHR